MQEKLSELRHQLEKACADLRAIESHLSKGENSAARERAQAAIVRMARLIEIENPHLGPKARSGAPKIRPKLPA